MTNSFAVHLGGGIYLDASGNIVVGPPTRAQIYQVPSGFRLDTEDLQEVFKGLSDILPSSEEDEEKWKSWGVPTDLFNFLGTISAVAGITATALAVYTWAVGILVDIMSAITGAPDRMSPELARVLQGFKNQAQGQEEIQRADKMIAMHSQFDGRIDSMNKLLTRLLVEKPVGAARAQVFADMQNIVDELGEAPLSELRNHEWATTYDVDAYRGRLLASILLVFERSDGSLAPVPPHSPDVTVFDYRLGMPMLLYGSTTFAALLQIAMPWFRSAGMYAGHLRKTADAIDRFVLRMQDESISRSEYTPTMVYQVQGDPALLSMWNPEVYSLHGEVRSSDSDSVFGTDNYPVGAFDLVRYDDFFLADQKYQHLLAHEDTGQCGLFNYHWFTPLDEFDFEGIAAAANKQARQDYARLQVTTGMIRLISTAAWLRYLSTPPDRSQTVSGFALDSRNFRDEVRATASSPPIFPTGVITHDATLKRYQARNRIRITTQEPGYIPAFRYRIVLRTLDSLFGKEGWQNLDYAGDVWRASYEPTSTDPRCNRLRTELRQNRILTEVELYNGPSPSQPVTRGGDDEPLQAATFDWYVPVVSPWSSFGDMALTIPAEKFAGGDSSGGKETMLGSGGVSIHLLGNDAVAPVPMPVRGGPSPLVATRVDELLDIGDLGTLADISLDKAERRHVKIEQVKVKWQLNWTANQLEVRLFGRPTDRPFQAHVVVEEIVYSGETSPEDITDVLSDQQFLERIHTPFVAEMINQLILVPEIFFREERKAIQRGGKMLSEFERRFAKHARVGPGEPIEHLRKSVREMANRSSSTSTIAAMMNERVEFATRQAPELWDSVLREAEHEHDSQ